MKRKGFLLDLTFKFWGDDVAVPVGFMQMKNP